MSIDNGLLSRPQASPSCGVQFLGVLAVSPAQSNSLSARLIEPTILRLRVSALPTELWRPLIKVCLAIGVLRFSPSSEVLAFSSSLRF